ncbi:FAD/NAD(P)-binding protein [bacterium]|nr:FAD/NAD(P)-binding protein [bacterium]
MNNPYIPKPVRIEEIITETEDRSLKTFRLAFLNKEDEQAFSYVPGQFAELSIAGKGEIPIGIASSPTEEGYLLFTVNKVGIVTSHLHNMSAGEIMGVRGPLGKPYPINELKGKNVVIIGGGFAFTTLRSTIAYMLANRSEFGKITVIYGARTPGMLLYKEQLKEWEARNDIDLNVTVDKGDESWSGKVGFVPTVTKEVAPSAEDAYALVCGPPIMIKFTQPVLIKLGWTPETIIMSLENRMKCGIGICGRCNVGPKYTCKDGPVFTLAELNELPKEY